jgi:hypothetical protein
LAEGASPAPPPVPPPAQVEWCCWRPQRPPAPLPPARPPPAPLLPTPPPPAPPLPPVRPPRLLPLVQLKEAPPWHPVLLLLLAPWSTQQVRRPPPPGWFRALGVWRPPVPDHWVRQLLERTGGRTPQLGRLRHTCSMRPKKGACQIINKVRAPGRQMEK